MIFVDTSFWVALRNRRDPHHETAAQLFDEHRATALLTTNHVVGETWTYLRRKAGHASAVGFLRGTSDSRRVAIDHVAPELEQRAFRWLTRHDEREYSFVDATSFEVMRSNRMTQALAFDGDFSAAGFTEVRP